MDVTAGARGAAANAAAAAAAAACCRAKADGGRIPLRDTAIEASSNYDWERQETHGLDDDRRGGSHPASGAAALEAE
ncbi:hypothetical protein GUJ93_ZPchr0012g20134 [Zizania palustris]|uniref:Uncharacterized protein n=1 Tax=Zizania palustris TaxID=103762 RepID=A0A8J5WTQ0_ZIZPA|nr:hypothetical protein GUJ93_ZPchr0012g20134 [Zizania palustris]